MHDIRGVESLKFLWYNFYVMYDITHFAKPIIYAREKGI